MITLRQIVAAYPDPLTRLYCLIRFRIIRERFLVEIGQYLPERGLVYEVGCGFGLFAIYFAAAGPDRRVVGIDIDDDRIASAVEAADRVGLHNVEFHVGDAKTLEVPEGVDALYMLDILHHIPRTAARDLLKQCHDRLGDDGVLLIKDVDTRPRWKMAFTWLLDVIMTKGERPEYWATPELVGELRAIGFDVARHAMVDLLPYPHQLYICSKAVGSDGRGQPDAV